MTKCSVNLLKKIPDINNSLALRGLLFWVAWWHPLLPTWSFLHVNYPSSQHILVCTQCFLSLRYLNDEIHLFGITVLMFKWCWFYKSDDAGNSEILKSNQKYFFYLSSGVITKRLNTVQKDTLRERPQSRNIIIVHFYSCFILFLLLLFSCCT